MKTGIITGTTGWLDEEGCAWTHPSVGRLWECLRERLVEVSLCLPILENRAATAIHRVDFPPSSIVPLPPLATTIQSQRYYRQTRQAVKRFSQTVDRLFIRLPFQLPGAIRHLRCPKLLHVVSSPADVIRASTDYRGLMKWAACKFAEHSERSMRHLAAEPSTRVCTNGSEMWHRLNCQHGRIVVSSCLKREEIRPRTAFDLNDPPRLLFIGYFRPEKGLGVLIDAFEQLRRTRPLKLTLAGGKDRATGVEAEIVRRVEASPFRDDIAMLGNIPYGEQLFDLFRTHDMFVLPSLSEGTPRTLVEARAFGCPVVASRVGGIPSSVQHEQDGLLVEPGNCELLAVAIEQLLRDSQLRLRMIAEGLRSGDRLSIENFADQLVTELAQVAT